MRLNLGSAIRTTTRLTVAVTLAASAVAGASADDMRPQAPLAGTAWRLLEFRSMDDAVGVVRPNDPSRYTMQLDADGTVNMRLDCNRGNGTWSIEPSADPSNGRFELGPLATTKALCPPPNLDEMIARQAPYIRGYLLREGRLYLSLMADGGIFAWEPLAPEPGDVAVPASADDGGPRDWVVTGVSRSLNLREMPSTSAPVLTGFAAGTVLDNLGCRDSEGRVWCDVQPLGGGPRGWVAASYLEPAVAPDGTVARGPDDSALRAGQGEFDATGTLPCAQTLGQPMAQCDFGVARAGGGYATVVITRPDGRTRVLFFRMNRAIGADTSQADTYPEFSATREGDLHLIRVGGERYEVPDAVVLGG